MHMQLASVQFHLINTVILFLSREGFRRGCLRTPVVTLKISSSDVHMHCYECTPLHVL